MKRISLSLSSGLLVLILAACPALDPSEEPDASRSMTADADEHDSSTIDSATPDAGEPDASESAPDMPIVPGEIPDEVKSSGARFAGRIGAGERIRIDLTVFQADRLTMWLRQVNDTSWDPAIGVYEKGATESLVWGNPRGHEDAHIPFREVELSEGYEFWFTGTYDLVLENRADTAGDFEFTLDCVGGPCGIDSGDADLDGIADADDDCPFYPGNDCTDPYAAMSNAELEDAIRSDSAGHVVMNYVEARVHMFAWIDNESGQVEGVYTGERVSTVEIPDASDMNTEHTWPQGRSGGDPATESDLHHLFPTKPDANTERASNYFGEVSQVEWERGGSRSGRDGSGNDVFEPRDSHKGAVARALFYYAVKYEQDIPEYEESVLRQWHAEDPPDVVDRRRNQSIAHVQRSRNPFIDFPELVDRISDF